MKLFIRSFHFLLAFPRYIKCISNKNFVCKKLFRISQQRSQQILFLISDIKFAVHEIRHLSFLFPCHHDSTISEKEIVVEHAKNCLSLQRLVAVIVDFLAHTPTLSSPKLLNWIFWYFFCSTSGGATGPTEINSLSNAAPPEILKKWSCKTSRSN